MPEEKEETRIKKLLFVSVLAAGLSTAFAADHTVAGLTSQVQFTAASFGGVTKI